MFTKRIILMLGMAVGLTLPTSGQGTKGQPHGSEVLINIDAESREEVDAFAETVRKAGGKIYAEPGESQGFMYAFGFEDPDGHRWSMLYIDYSKMPVH